ncbi:MAG: 3-hydroxyacyl-CoA dehydrogenase NAD-binding domain-containing protein [bacterium]|nr:3-hydroxyacyl-CoA dehydrogenase NAD-binding domain-containing protein [bacterium]
MIVGICGAGTMGRGIAIASLAAGHTVVLFDAILTTLASADKNIADQLAKSVEKGKMSAEDRESSLSRLSTSTTLDGLANSDIVIEAILENLEIKQALFIKLEALCRPDALLTSNTSSISITALSSCLKTPTRFAGLHFFNPAHIMKLVEVVKGTLTSDPTVTACVEFANGLSKKPIVAKDVPGFVVNRVARNFYNEAQRIVMENAASIPQVDTLMKALGFKMGPFELMDLIGVDVNLDVTKSMYAGYFNEPRFNPSLLQQQYVDAGLHGRKTKKGFYDHEG